MSDDDRATQPTTRLILLGCVASKRDLAPDQRVKARDLYDSPLWRARRAYAEASGHPWLILSAHYGLTVPWWEIRTYDVTIRERGPFWGAAVSAQLVSTSDMYRGDSTILEVHAGAPYVDALHEALTSWLAHEHLTIEHPVKGLRIGEQLAWYAARAKDNDDNKQEEE